MKCNQSRPEFELVLPCPFLTTITITSRAPPHNNNNNNNNKKKKKKKKKKMKKKKKKKKKKKDMFPRKTREVGSGRGTKNT